MLVLDMYATDACMMHGCYAAVVELFIVVYVVAVQTGNACKKRTSCCARVLGCVAKTHVVEHRVYQQTDLPQNNVTKFVCDVRE